MSGLLASGNLFMDRKADDGTSTGLLLVGNATKFDVSETTEKKERISTGIETYGQALDTVTIKKPAQVAIAMNDLDKDNLAMALLGDVATLNQGSGSLDGEAINAKEGRFVELSKGNLTSATVVVKDQTDTTTYAEGTDYEVNYRIGMIKALAGGGITDGDEIHVSADYMAISGATISGSVRPTIKAKLLLEGKNLTTGKAIIVRVGEAVLTPSSAINFMSNDYSSLELSGTLTTLAGETTPYTVEMRD